MKRCLAGLILAVGAVLGGCDTLGNDLNDFAMTLLPPSPTEAVQWAASADPDLRRRGTLLLSNAYFGGEPEYVALYRDYVRHEANPLVRAAAIRALAKHGGPDDAELIAVHLVDPNLQVRWEAAKGLQRIHAPVIASALVATLRDVEEHQEVRVAAATALGQYAEDFVFQALITALDDRSLAINLAARSSLETMTGVDQGLDRGGWLAWYNEAGQPFANRQDYFYPTYHRAPTWFERMIFWSTRVNEQPGPPAGLRSVNERSTYGDEPGSE